MSRRKLTIALPAPCEESWEAMQPVSGGRRCDSCAKTVVDLSSYTDAQLIDFFSRKRSAGACCRLRDDQLNRTMQEPPQRNIRSVIWQRAAALLLAAQVFVTESVAQRTKKVHQTVRMAGKGQKPAQRYLKGQILGMSAHTKQWQYAAIALQLGDTGVIHVTPDSNLHFKIPLPQGFKEGTIRWAMQEIGGGTILDDSVVVDAAVVAAGIELEWQAPAIMPVSTVSAPARPNTYGGAPVSHFEREPAPKRPSVFTRLFGRRYKNHP
jgi:hypothetical protein